MDFSLSSSLVGSAVLNPDKLSLDLQFAADKTLTARTGPTPTFTRGSAATFVGSNGLIQSAAVNAARFDHDPVTLACKGLLIEESRTNVALYSGALVLNIGWTFIQSLPATSGAGPDGNTAYRVTETATLDNHLFGNTGGVGGAGATSVVSGTVYTGSIFLKKVTGSVDWAQLSFSSAGFGAAQYANFNIGNGTIGNSSGLASGTVPRIEAFPNGWYRCSISAAAVATTSSTSNIVTLFTNNLNAGARAPVYTGSTSNSVLATMAQFEVGSFPTSYIPTVASSVIRSADVCSITGSAFTGFYNQSEGTVSMSASTARSGNSVVLYAITDGTISNQILALPGSSSFSVNVLGSSQANLDTGVFTNNAVSLVASAFKLNDFASSRNGGTVSTDNAGTLPTVSQLGIGSRISAVQLNGHIQYLRYFKKRLANAKLITLTT